MVSPTLDKGVSASYGNNTVTVQATGVMPVMTQIRNYALAGGRFITDQDVTARENVVVLGYQTAVDLFGSESPVGKSVRVSGISSRLSATLKKWVGWEEIALY